MRMSSFVKSGTLLIAMALLVAGCGIKGSLDAPPGAKAAGTATSPAAKGTGKDSAAPKKKHRPFILDGMLR